jgi:hypothetical protein
MMPMQFATSDITSNSATVSWHPAITTDPYGYEYVCSDVNTAPDNAAPVNTNNVVTDTVANIQGLNGNTTYYVWVRTICDEVAPATSLWISAISFTTEQVPATVAYVTDFSATYATDNAQWQMVNYAPGNTSWYIGSTTGTMTPDDYPVTDALYLSNDGGATNSFNGSPLGFSFAYRKLNFTDAGGYTITYDYRVGGEAELNYLRAFIVPDSVPMDVSFVLDQTTYIDVFSTINPAGWIALDGGHYLIDSIAGTTQTVNISIPSAGIYNLVIFWTNNNSDYNYGGLAASVDNINIEQPACEFLVNLSYANVTVNSADISWVAPANIPDEGYEYYISTENVAPATAAAVDMANFVTDTMANLTDLEANTTYYVWVRSICNSSNSEVSSWSTTPLVFATLCLTIDMLPFAETFEDTSTTLNCWTIINANNDDDAWTFANSSYNAHSGSYSAQIYTDYNAGVNNDWLISPAITLSEAAILTYWYKARSSAEPDAFEVLLSTTGNQPADFTHTLLPSTEFNNTTYQEKKLDLSGYSNSTVYIAWHVPQGGPDGYYINIDDVTVRLISSEKDILTFSLPQQTGPATIDADNYTVDIEVSYGTDIDTTQLTPTITTSLYSTISPASGVAQNFSTPVTYTVMAEDSSTQVWTVTVSVVDTASALKEILTFNIPNTISTVIDHNNLTVDILMQWTTFNLTALTPTITTSPFSTLLPASGTAQDFTNPVTYTVTAQDGTTADYTVTVTVQVMPKVGIPYVQDFEDLSSVDEITCQNSTVNKWAIGSATGNPGNSLYISDDNGVTNAYNIISETFSSAFVVLDFDDNGLGEPYVEHTISFDWKAKGESEYWDFMQVFIVPFDMPVPAIRPSTTYTYSPWMTGTGVIKLNNLANGMQGAFGQSSSWKTFTTSIRDTNLSGLKKLLFIWFNDASSGTQPPAAIDNISVTGTNCTAPSNFTWTNITPISADLTWDALGATGWNLKVSDTAIDPTTTAGTQYDDQVGQNSHSIASLLPNTTYYAYVQMDCGSAWATASFTTPDACATPIGLTVNNITPHTATVTWNALGMTDWNIKISTTQLTNPDTATADILNDGTANGIAAFDASSLPAQTTLYVYVRTDCGGTYSQHWGSTLFTTPCEYVSVIPWNEDFTGLSSNSFPDCWYRYNNNAVSTSNPYINTINNMGTTTNSPSGSPYIYFSNSTSLTLVSPSFENDINQYSLSFYVSREGSSSGTFSVGYLATPQNPASFVAIDTFDAPDDIWIQHAVTLSNIPDGIKQFAFRQNQIASSWYYWLDDITVKEQSDSNNILTFSFAEQLAPATIDATTHTVDIEVSYSANLTALVPTITVSPMATISPESGAVQNFSTPFTYTVTSETGIAQLWTVTVTPATTPSSEKDILTFDIPNQVSSTVNTAAHTVDILMPWTTLSVTALEPAITVSSLATVSPASDVATDFTNPVTYTVTAEDNSTATYIVTVTIQPIPSVTLPYAQDFSDSTAAVADFIFNSGKGYYTITSSNDNFVIGSATGNPAKSLYVSNNNGIANAYSENDAFATAELIVDFGNHTEYTLSFDWKCGGEGGVTDYDYGNVYIMNLNENITSYNLPTDALNTTKFVGNGTSWTTATYTLSGATYANTVKKIVFAWRSDVSTIESDPLAIDNISIVPVSLCAVPTGVTAGDITSNSANISWTENGTATKWQVAWKEATASNWNNDIATATTYGISGLAFATNYEVKVRAICGAADTSNWSNTATFTTLACNKPANVEITEITATTITLTWEATNGETKWSVIWRSTTAGSGSAIVENTPTTILTELTPATDYEICVVAICMEGVEGGESAEECKPASTTAIHDLTLANSLQLYPNPTTGELRIKNYELQEGDKIEVYNMLGQKQQLTTDHYQLTTINVSHLSAGVYTVKIGGYVGKFVKK